MHTHSRTPHTHTHTCLQSPHHLVTQSRHLWVAFDGLYSDTDIPQGVQSALLLQTSMENLILLCCILSFCDGSLVTFVNNVSFQKVPDNFLCIYFIYELVPKLVQNFFSCMEEDKMERAESCYTKQPNTSHVHCRTTSSTTALLINDLTRRLPQNEHLVHNPEYTVHSISCH